VTSPSGSAYDPSGVAGLQCVNSGTLATYGATYAVNFPAPGNFKFTCLIHASMFGLVHVVDPSADLPYTQQAYNLQTVGQTVNVTSELTPEGLGANGAHPRVYTVGKVVATGGGWQYGSLFPFVDASGGIITKDEPLHVRVGQTVEFTNIDPVEPHTITFGCPTDDPTCPFVVGPGGFLDTSGPSGTAADGARYAVLTRGSILLTERNATPTPRMKSTPDCLFRRPRTVPPESARCPELREQRCRSRRLALP